MEHLVWANVWVLENPFSCISVRRWIDLCHKNALAQALMAELKLMAVAICSSCITWPHCIARNSREVWLPVTPNALILVRPDTTWYDLYQTCCRSKSFNARLVYTLQRFESCRNFRILWNQSWSNVKARRHWEALAQAAMAALTATADQGLHIPRAVNASDQAADREQRLIACTQWKTWIGILACQQETAAIDTLYMLHQSSLSQQGTRQTDVGWRNSHLVKPDVALKAASYCQLTAAFQLQARLATCSCSSRSKAPGGSRCGQHFRGPAQLPTHKGFPQEAACARVEVVKKYSKFSKKSASLPVLKHGQISDKSIAAASPFELCQSLLSSISHGRDSMAAKGRNKVTMYTANKNPNALCLHGWFLCVLRVDVFTSWSFVVINKYPRARLN